jgi:hypothetical protein
LPRKSEMKIKTVRKIKWRMIFSQQRADAELSKFRRNA